MPAAGRHNGVLTFSPPWRAGIPTIMRVRAYPASYSEVCDTFRPRLACARRTDSGGERFIDFLVPGPVRGRFVAEHVSEGRPAGIEVSQPPQKPRILDLFPIGQGSEVFEALEQTGQGFDTVPIDQQHRRKLMRLSVPGKGPKLAEMSTFTTRSLNNAQACARSVRAKPKERHILPGTSAGVSVPYSP